MDLSIKQNNGKNYGRVDVNVNRINLANMQVLKYAYHHGVKILYLENPLDLLLSKD